MRAHAQNDLNGPISCRLRRSAVRRIFVTRQVKRGTSQGSIATYLTHFTSLHLPEISENCEIHKEGRYWSFYSAPLHLYRTQTLLPALRRCWHLIGPFLSFWACARMRLKLRIYLPYGIGIGLSYLHSYHIFLIGKKAPNFWLQNSISRMWTRKQAPRKARVILG